MTEPTSPERQRIQKEIIRQMEEASGTSGPPIRSSGVPPTNDTISPAAQKGVEITIAKSGLLQPQLPPPLSNRSFQEMLSSVAKQIGSKASSEKTKGTTEGEAPPPKSLKIRSEVSSNVADDGMASFVNVSSKIGEFSIKETQAGGVAAEQLANLGLTQAQNLAGQLDEINKLQQQIEALNNDKNANQSVINSLAAELLSAASNLSELKISPPLSIQTPITAATVMDWINKVTASGGGYTIDGQPLTIQLLESKAHLPNLGQWQQSYNAANQQITNDTTSINSAQSTIGLLQTTIFKTLGIPTGGSLTPEVAAALQKARQLLQAILNVVNNQGKGDALATFINIRAAMSNASNQEEQEMGQVDEMMSNLNITSAEQMKKIGDAITAAIEFIDQAQDKLADLNTQINNLQDSIYAFSAALVVLTLASFIPGAAAVTGPLIAVDSVIIGALMISQGALQLQAAAITKQVGEDEKSLAGMNQSYAQAQASSNQFQELTAQMTDSIGATIKKIQEMAKETQDTLDQASAAIASVQRS